MAMFLILRKQWDRRETATNNMFWQKNRKLTKHIVWAGKMLQRGKKPKNPEKIRVFGCKKIPHHHQ
jgi:hypothetical protein